MHVKNILFIFKIIQANTPGRNGCGEAERNAGRKEEVERL
jgi:hypothetical protein